MNKIYMRGQEFSCNNIVRGINMKKQYCIICGKPLNSGIIINRKGICDVCEERMVNSDMSTDFYEFYKKCIRKNLVQTFIKDEEMRWENYRF